MELYVRVDLDHMQGFQVADMLERLAHDFRTAADAPRPGESGKVYDVDGEAIGIWAIVALPH